MFILCFLSSVGAKHFHSAKYLSLPAQIILVERLAGMRLFVLAKCPALSDFDHKHSATSDLSESS
jgi:hypothetical protein